MPHEVDIVKVRPMTVAVVRFTVHTDDLPRIGEQMGPAFEKVASELGAAHVPPLGAPMAYFEPAADGFEVAAGFPVPATATVPASLGRLDVAETEAAHTTHIGPYQEMPSTYEDLLAQASAAGRAPRAGGPMWETYLSAPETPADRTRTEVYWVLSSSATDAALPH
ncbi:hypothetical protein JCM18899A_41060 [Nocardioides sp. AN3]